MDEQLFSQHQAAPAAQLTALATRLKLADERCVNLSKRNQITEASLLAFEKDMKAELRALTRQSVELRKHLSDVNAKVDMILGELTSVVQKHEFLAAERYLDLWQPMQFITREEAKRLIQDKVEKQEVEHA